MRPITAGLAGTALLLLLADAAAAGIVGLRPGGVRGLGPSAPHSIAPKAKPGGRHDVPHPPHRPGHRPRPPHGHLPYGFVVPFYVAPDPAEPETIYVPAPEPEQPTPEAPPPEPLDPKGTIRRIPARGVAAPDTAPALGAAIAQDVPLVILDWRAHDLPEPPPGDVWVRLRRDVLRIDATTRVVHARPPEEDAAAGAEADGPPPER